NKYLVKFLTDNNMYNPEMIDYLLDSNGSIQGIEGIPDNIKNLFKTAWEIKQKSIMQLAIDRQPFIDQSQSMNLWFEDYDDDTFTSAQFFAWENGLKTGSYYTRTREAYMPNKITVSETKSDTLANVLKNMKITDKEYPEEDDEICLMCSA
ncbi:MAG: hypothetical protein ACRCZI_02870, partial [Cetobacterium sp.]